MLQYSFLFEIVSLIDVRHVIRLGVNFVKFFLEELLNELNYKVLHNWHSLPIISTELIYSTLLCVGICKENVPDCCSCVQRISILF